MYEYSEIDYPNAPYCHPLFETMTGNIVAFLQGYYRVLLPKLTPCQVDKGGNIILMQYYPRMGRLRRNIVVTGMW